MRRVNILWLICCVILGCGSGETDNNQDATGTATDNSDTIGDLSGSSGDSGPATECQGQPDNEPCDDGDVCTMNDRCEDELCVGGAKNPCDQQGDCRVGSCNPDIGCEYADANEGTECSAPCYSEGSCELGVCVGTPDSVVECPKSQEECVAALQCDPGTGDCTMPVYRAENTPCNLDNNVCTVELCSDEGLCVSNSELSPCAAEELAEPCWNYTCAVDSGCVVSTFNEGTQCDDGDACTADDLCTSSADGQGACQGQSFTPDDQNPCTKDLCKDGEIVHTPADGVDCEPGDGCAGPGICKASVCVPIKPCTDG